MATLIKISVTVVDVTKTIGKKKGASRLCPRNYVVFKVRIMPTSKGCYSFNSRRRTIFNQKHSAAGIQDKRLPIILFETLYSFCS